MNETRLKEIEDALSAMAARHGTAPFIVVLVWSIDVGTAHVTTFDRPSESDVGRIPEMLGQSLPYRRDIIAYAVVMSAWAATKTNQVTASATYQSVAVRDDPDRRDVYTVAYRERDGNLFQRFYNAFPDGTYEHDPQFDYWGDGAEVHTRWTHLFDQPIDPQTTRVN